MKKHIEELSKNILTLSIIPNTTNGITTIQANTETKNNIHFQVINSQGKIIFTEIINSKSNKFERKIDFSYQENGIYYFRLQAGNQIATAKIVKMH